MTPSLREAAKAALVVYEDRDFIRLGPSVTTIDPWLGRLFNAMGALESALATEEEKPKVERVVVGHLSKGVGEGGYFASNDEAWNLPMGEYPLYAERPIPAKKSKREELAEWLDFVADEQYAAHRESSALKTKAAAAELRRKEP